MSYNFILCAMVSYRIIFHFSVWSVAFVHQKNVAIECRSTDKLHIWVFVLNVWWRDLFVHTVVIQCIVFTECFIWQSFPWFWVSFEFAMYDQLYNYDITKVMCVQCYFSHFRSIADLSPGWHHFAIARSTGHKILVNGVEVFHGEIDATEDVLQLFGSGSCYGNLVTICLLCLL